LTIHMYLRGTDWRSIRQSRSSALPPPWDQTVYFSFLAHSVGIFPTLLITFSSRLASRNAAPSTPPGSCPSAFGRRHH
jgi:hypothetical protein